MHTYSAIHTHFMLIGVREGVSAADYLRRVFVTWWFGHLFSVITRCQTHLVTPGQRHTARSLPLNLNIVLASHFHLQSTGYYFHCCSFMGSVKEKLKSEKKSSQKEN